MFMVWIIFRYKQTRWFLEYVKLLFVLFEENLCQQIEYSEQWVSFGEDATRNFDHHSRGLDKSFQNSKMEKLSWFQDMGVNILLG